MNTLKKEPARELCLLNYRDSFFVAEEIVEIEQLLLDTLASSPPGAVVTVNFLGVRIASEAARQLLKRALLRLGSGELEDRFLILDHLGRSHYSVEAMLRLEGLTAVERTPDGPRLIGKVDSVAAATFEFVASQGEVTAKAILQQFKLQNIAAATNRLTALTKSALVRRTGPRPLPSGGREYVFTAVS